jgi:uncharacterized protein
MENSLDRRNVLRGAAVAAGLAAVAPLEALAARSAGADTSLKKEFSADYGALAPVKDQATGLELLLLPRGFEYVSFGWTGDRMADGIATPPAHDGMAAFRRDDRIHLVRNHEVGSFSGKFADPAYDPQAGGGTTNLVFDPEAGALVEARSSLSGTIRNCAGGPTPWGSWLTCEETMVINPASGARHGYVFEVPNAGTGNPNPIKAMGRFSHEAVAVDPATGYVYETEDDNPAGFFRFRPTTTGNLHGGGVLEMLVINGAAYDTRRDATGTTYASTSWVTIDQPDPATGRPTTEGLAKGGAAFARLEGAWYSEGKIYIVSTSGGPTGQGQVFEYEPASGVMRVLFASPSAAVLNNPDNICVSPRGGIVLCEDGSGVEYLHGLTTDGEIFPFAANNVVIPAGGAPGHAAVPPGDYRSSEWCGATFEPKNGDWLFVNIQTPGITFAITGPWKQGSL